MYSSFKVRKQVIKDINSTCSCLLVSLSSLGVSVRRQDLASWGLNVSYSVVNYSNLAYDDIFLVFPYLSLTQGGASPTIKWTAKKLEVRWGKSQSNLLKYVRLINRQPRSLASTERRTEKMGKTGSRENVFKGRPPCFGAVTCLRKLWWQGEGNYIVFSGHAVHVAGFYALRVTDHFVCAFGRLVSTVWSPPLTRDSCIPRVSYDASLFKW